MIKNINTNTQIGILLVAGGIILCIIAIISLYKHKDDETYMISKANRSNMLATVLCATVLFMIILGLVFCIIFLKH